MTSTKPADTTLTETAARLRLAIARMARRMRQEAGAELSPTSVAALATVERHGPLTPSELADHERIKRPTATRVLRFLEEADLAERMRDPEDGRSALISVTAEGRERLRRLRRRKNAYLARRMRDLGPGEVAALERAAEILEGMLEEERAAGEGRA
jgi:DNA-binding MarR family transcriptional regulator